MNGPSQFRRSFIASLGAAAVSAVLPLARARAESEPAQESRAAAWLAVDLLGTDGRQMSLGQIAAPVVIVHVWASWCPACLGELTSIQELADRLSPAGVATLLVSHPKHWDRDAEYLQRARVRLPAYTLAPDVPWAMREAVFDMTDNTYSVPRTLVFAGRERHCVLVKDGPEDWQSPRVTARLRTLVGAA